VKWYKSYYEEDKLILTKNDLFAYVKDAKSKKIVWTK